MAGIFNSLPLSTPGPCGGVSLSSRRICNSCQPRMYSGKTLSLQAPPRRFRPSADFICTALAVGDKLPDCKLTYFNAEGQMEEISTMELVSGKKVVIFAVPGAFTPTCSVKHLPGFIDNSDDLKSKGVDTIACVSVNDAFVMDAWGKSVGADGKVLMLADGSALFTKALGVELDLADKGLGVRSRRYAMLLEDGLIKVLNLEEGGAFTISSAEDILAAL